MSGHPRDGADPAGDEGDVPGDERDDERSVAGAVVVWSAEAPRLLALRASRAGLVLGRENLAHTGDDRLSRQHARIRWHGTRFEVTDLGSRNGTFVGGSLITDGEVTALPPVVVRTGRTISVLVPDVRPYEHATVAVDHGAVVGPTLRPLWDEIGRAALTGASLLVTGEDGVGKGMAARMFHRASGATGELIAVGGDGEARALERHLAAAAGGTLYIGEVAALAPAAQARLLRVLEPEAVGRARGRRPAPDVRVVAASQRELRAEVAAGRLDGALLARLARLELHLPPLRDRLEDIPWLVAEVVREARLPPHPSLVEACLLRPWPGNVRELVTEVGRAARAARAAARKAVRLEDLDGSAGVVSGEAATIGPGALRARATLPPDPERG